MTSANSRDAGLRQTPRLGMLVALTSGFALSQAYRTFAALMAPQLQTDFAASPQALGTFAGAFHFAFGATQIFVGIGIDLYGIRRTVLTAFPVVVAGSLSRRSAIALSGWCSARR